jgi:hypothetical protein
MCFHWSFILHPLSCGIIGLPAPDVRQLAMGRNVSRLGDDDEARFGLGPIEVADELAVDLVQLELSEGLEIQLGENSDIVLVVKKQPLVTGFGNTRSQGVSGLATIHNASKSPERAGGQLRNPRVLV